MDPPPRPRLFKAIAILGLVIGGLGAVNSIGVAAVLARSQSLPLAPLGLEIRTDQEARIARRMKEAAERVIDRHRRVSSGLTIANALLSGLLFVAAAGMGSRRGWARGFLIQAAIGCALYELPATAHQMRLEWEAMRAQERFLPDYLAAIDEPHAPSDIAIRFAYSLMMATLRLLYFGIAIHYLRREDVRIWFQRPEPEL